MVGSPTNVTRSVLQRTALAEKVVQLTRITQGFMCDQEQHEDRIRHLQEAHEEELLKHVKFSRERSDATLKNMKEVYEASWKRGKQACQEVMGRHVRHWDERLLSVHQNLDALTASQKAQNDLFELTQRTWAKQRQEDVEQRNALAQSLAESAEEKNALRLSLATHQREVNMLRNALQAAETSAASDNGLQDNASDSPRAVAVQLDVHAAKEHTGSLQQEVDAAQAQLSAMHTELRAVQEECRIAHEEADVARLQHQAVQHDINVAHVQCRAMQDEMNDAHKQLCAMQEEVGAAREKHRISRHEADTAQNHNRAMQDELEASHRRHDVTQEKLNVAQMERRGAQEELDAAREQYRAMEEKASCAYKELRSIQEELDVAQQRCRAARNEVDALQNYNQALQEEMDAAHKEHDITREKLDFAHDERRTAQKELDAARDRHRALQHQFGVAYAQRHAVDEELRAAHTQRGAMQEEIDVGRDTLHALQESLSASDTQRAALQAAVDDAAERHRVMDEELAGARQKLRAAEEDADMMRQEVENLKSQKAEAVSELQKELECEKAAAIEEMAAMLHGKVEAVDKLTATVQEMQDTREELNAELVQCEKDKTTALKELAARELRCADLQGAADSAQAQRAMAEQRERAMAAELQGTQRDANTLKDNLACLHAELDEVAQTQAQFVEAKRTSDDMRTELQAQYDALSKSVAEMREKETSSTTALAAQVAETKGQEKTLMEEVRAVQAVCDRTEAAKEAQGEALCALRVESAKWRADTEEAQTATAAAEKHAAQVAHEMDHLRKVLDVELRLKKEVDAQHASEREESRALRSECAEIRKAAKDEAKTAEQKHLLLESLVFKAEEELTKHKRDADESHKALKLSMEAALDDAHRSAEQALRTLMCEHTEELEKVTKRADEAEKARHGEYKVALQLALQDAQKFQSRAPPLTVICPGELMKNNTNVRGKLEKHLPPLHKACPSRRDHRKTQCTRSS